MNLCEVYMQIKVSIQNMATENVRECLINVDSSMSMQNLFDLLGCTFSDVSDYYPYSGVYSWNAYFLPYVFCEKNAIYDVSYDQANLFDFLQTHNIENDTLYIKTGYPHAGGPGFLELKEIWQSVYPVLEEISVFSSISGLSLFALIKWFCHHFRRRKTKPQTCFDIIYARTRWSHYELASILKITPKQAKSLLVLFGYNYVSAEQQYLQGDNVEEIKNKLTNVKSVDI